jgi:hypothetical protein
MVWNWGFALDFYRGLGIAETGGVAVNEEA